MATKTQAFSTFLVFLIIFSLEISGAQAKNINGKFTSGIVDYHLSIPHKLTGDGDFSSFHLPHFHDFDASQYMKRKKRELDDPDIVHYGVFFNDKLHHIELWPNRDIVHPRVIVQEYDSTIPVADRVVRGLKKDKMCYYHGRVRGEDDSMAALATCDGLAGLISIKGNLYFIEPVNKHSPNDKGHHMHVIYKPTATVRSYRCGVNTSSEHWEEAIGETLRHRYMKDKNMFKRDSASPPTFEVVPKYMEMMLVIDKKMVELHKGKRDIEEYIITILNGVKALYSDSSMTNYIIPVIVRIMYLEKQEAEIDLEITNSINPTLASFCPWASKLNVPEDNPNHFDTAVLLSAWDFCTPDEPHDKEADKCSVIGLAFIAKACDGAGHQCQVNEDNGMLTMVTVTHEQGHLIGMPHDGQGKSLCQSKNPYGEEYIMSPFNEMSAKTWSPCSLGYMHVLNDNHMLDCFDDPPTGELYSLGDNTLPGVIYDEAEQCLVDWRGEQTYCEMAPREECAPLYCFVPKEGTCFNAGRIKADGTKCGEKKWCFNSSCVDVGARPKSVDGGWGEWSDWSTCTRTCGRGVQQRERLCNNPKPENHGRFCLGQAIQYKLCNTDDCPDDTPSFRAEQCVSKINESAGWFNLDPENFDVPEFREDAPCSLFCTFVEKEDRNMRTVVNLIPAVVDGTACNPGTKDVCISGKCMKVGCDNVLNSEAIDDRCGNCNGDGTMCKIITGGYAEPQHKISYYEKLLEIPAGTRKFEVKDTNDNGNIFVLTNEGNTSIYLNANNRFESAGYYALGSKKNFWAIYSQEGKGDNKETIKINRVKETLWFVLNHKTTRRPYPDIVWSWAEPTDDPTYEPHYHWESDEFEECDVLCGGGVQKAKLNCLEDKAGVVSSKYCDKIDKPEPKTRKCNEPPCRTEWRTGPWGRCRACKNKGGVRVRTVQCVQVKNKAQGDDVLKEDSACEAPKPGTVELCEAAKKCGSRKRKAPFIPGKYQDTIWQQMNKLHLVKREANAENKTKTTKKAFKTTRKPFMQTIPVVTGNMTTTPFTWLPTLTTGNGEPQIEVDLGRKIKMEVLKFHKSGNLTKSNLTANEEVAGIKKNEILNISSEIINSEDFNKKRVEENLRKKNKSKNCTRKNGKKVFAQMALP